jgi:hypothetical protein
MVLVTGLAVAWIVTAHAGHRGGAATVAGAEAGPTAVAPSSGPSGLSGPSITTAIAASNAARPRRSIRSDGSVRVAYRTLRGDGLQAAYLAALAPGLRGGSATLGSGSGPPACAHGGEEERAWSRPAAPARAVGRYACRIEDGRAAMWWTIEDRGLLAHAVAPDADLASLFEWWESHSER